MRMAPLLLSWPTVLNQQIVDGGRSLADAEGLSVLSRGTTVLEMCKFPGSTCERNRSLLSASLTPGLLLSLASTSLRPRLVVALASS